MSAEPFYCAVKPLEEYGGLSQNYSGEFLSLILIATLIPFSYELEEVSEDLRISTLTPKVIDAINQTLEFKVGNKTISDLLVRHDPVDFYRLASSHGFDDWPMLRMSEKITPDMMNLTVNSRAVYWALYSRAVIKVQDNLVKAKFGSDLTGVTPKMFATYMATIRVLKQED